MLRRRLALAALAVAAAVGVAPAQAAPGAQKVFFANVAEGTETGCVQNYQLVKAQIDGNECSGTIIAVNDTGLVSNDTYTSEKKLTALKVDQSRKITGEIYVQHFPVVFFPGVVPQSSLPGYVDLEITVKLDTTVVGVIKISGPTVPTAGLKTPVSLAIPASLKGKTIKKVSAAVTWHTAVGLSGISYSQPTASFLEIPTR